MEIFPRRAPDSLMYSCGKSDQREDGKKIIQIIEFMKRERGNYLFKTNGCYQTI